MMHNVRGNKPRIVCRADAVDLCIASRKREADMVGNVRLLHKREYDVSVPAMHHDTVSSPISLVLIGTIVQMF